MTASKEANVEIIQAAIRELDESVHKLRASLLIDPEAYADARDHLQQIHFRLTECKGHLGAVKHNLKGA